MAKVANKVGLGEREVKRRTRYVSRYVGAYRPFTNLDAAVFAYTSAVGFRVRLLGVVVHVWIAPPAGVPNLRFNLKHGLARAATVAEVREWDDIGPIWIGSAADGVPVGSGGVMWDLEFDHLYEAHHHTFGFTFENRSAETGFIVVGFHVAESQE